MTPCVLLSLRYVSDGGVNEGGLLVDDIAVHPQEVQSWNVKLVGIRAGKVPTVLQVEWNGRRLTYRTHR